MAAVLCGGIGKACQGCCECAGAVCMAPFKCCGAICDGCGQCCQDTCNVITGCCSSSFCCYITVTLCLNIPPIAVGLMDIPNLFEGCQGSLWLLIFWLLCAINIAAAFYMSRAVDRDPDNILPTQQQQGISNFDASSGAGRMKHLFCYDGWMAVYILVLIGFFVWLLLGAGWFVTETDDESGTCEDLTGRVAIAYGFGWAFIFVGSCALCCSLCCGMFSGGSSGGGRPPVYNSQPQQQQTVVPASAAAAAPPSAANATTSDEPKKSSVFSFSTNANPTPMPPPNATAPPEVEVPIASAEPIYDDTNNDGGKGATAKATLY